MRFRRIKSGNNAVRQYQGRPMHRHTVQKTVRKYGEKITTTTLTSVAKMTLRERAKQHKLNHPNDKNVKSKEKGVHWGKKGNSHKDLMDFHKNHIWTYIDADMNKGWIKIGGEEE